MINPLLSSSADGAIPGYGRLLFFKYMNGRVQVVYRVLISRFLAIFAPLGSLYEVLVTDGDDSQKLSAIRQSIRSGTIKIQNSADCGFPDPYAYWFQHTTCSEAQLG